MSPLRRTKVKIGQLLLEKGLITEEQLQHALSLQRKEGQDKKLGQIFLELGYVDKDELFLSLAIQCGYPYIDINHCLIEPEVLSLLPRAMAEKYQVLPIDKIQDILTVAMVNPLDKLAIAEIQKFTQCNVKVFLTTPLELKEIISKYYKKGIE